VRVGSPPPATPQSLFTCNHLCLNVAVTLIEILTRREPYPELAGIQVAMEVSNGQLKPEIPSDVSKELRSVLSDCAQFEPKMRPSFDELYSTLENWKFS